MGASDDEDEYIVYGRPLQEEIESGKGQYAKEVQDKSITRALPVWQQEVVDEQGRRRLHGAFTGGYSAGYFNTVGSKDGWAPSAFKSSRDKRSESRSEQRAEDFMDEEELEELGRRKITANNDFDTFGHEAEERAKAAMQASIQERPGLPMGIIKDLIAPVPDSVGIRLLQKMGWRQGKGVGKRSSKSTSGSGSKWGEMSTVGVENVKFYDVPNKDDTYGLGHDPFKGAQDFRNAKEQKNKDPRDQIPAKRKRGVAFGTGVMDEDDTLGMTDDYVTDVDPKNGFNFEIHSEEEDEPPAQRHQFRDQYRLPGKSEPLRLQSSEQTRGVYDLIPGFIKATVIETLTHFPPPKVPPDFKPFHKFPSEVLSGQSAGHEPALPSPEIVRAIRTIAPFVARMGPAFEAVAIQKNSDDSNFAFLTGGTGAEYYRWTVRALKAAQSDTTGLVIGQRAHPLTANDRGLLLGESDMHNAIQMDAAVSTAGIDRRPPAGVAEGDKLALQEAMRATFTRGKKQDFETTNPDPKGFGLKLSSKAPAAKGSTAQEWLDTSKNRFASGTILAPEAAQGGLLAPKPAAVITQEKKEVRRLPTRTVVEWRPSPLLCKRFNVPDPFRGKPAYQPEAPQSKFDSLALPETAAAASHAASQPLSHQFGQATSNEGEHLALPPPPKRPSPIAASESLETKHGQPSAGELADDLLASLLGPPQGVEETQVKQPPIDKPINLFQAIFEDDSESESEDEDDDAQHKEAILQPPRVDDAKVNQRVQTLDPPSNSVTNSSNGMRQDSAQRRDQQYEHFRDEGKVRSGATANQHMLSTPLLQQSNTSVIAEKAGASKPTEEEIQEALRLVKRSRQKDKRKEKDKKKKGDKKKSKKSSGEKKHHKARRKSASSSEDD